MRLIFMGTPDFAVPCLQSLLDAGHDVCAVFTQPDKPKGRKFILTPPPVKVLAGEHDIPVFQPLTLKEETVQAQIRDLKPDAIVVVAYGKILPKAVLDIPPYGCINVHGSLLPKYRGAAPIQWAVINGEATTGVTTMYMAEGLDTGDMLMWEETPIRQDETADELYERLAQMGASLIVKTLDAVQKGTATRIPQGDSQTSYAAMLTKEMGLVDGNKSAPEIHNLIRGLSTWPVAYTFWNGKKLKLHKSHVVDGIQGEPGKIISEAGYLMVCCGYGTALELLEVQYEGGKRMSVKDFLRGHPIPTGTKF